MAACCALASRPSRPSLNVLGSIRIWRIKATCSGSLDTLCMICSTIGASSATCVTCERHR